MMKSKINILRLVLCGAMGLYLNVPDFRWDTYGYDLLLPKSYTPISFRLIPTSPLNIRNFTATNNCSLRKIYINNGLITLRNIAIESTIIQVQTGANSFVYIRHDGHLLSKGQSFHTDKDYTISFGSINFALLYAVFGLTIPILFLIFLQIGPSYFGNKYINLLFCFSVSFAICFSLVDISFSYW